MKRVKYTGKSPEYLDGFPEKCERSCKGAIHLLPNALRDITDDELKYIRKKYHFTSDQITNYILKNLKS